MEDIGNTISYGKSYQVTVVWNEMRKEEKFVPQAEKTLRRELE